MQVYDFNILLHDVVQMLILIDANAQTVGIWRHNNTYDRHR